MSVGADFVRDWSQSCSGSNVMPNPAIAHEVRSYGASAAISWVVNARYSPGCN